MSFWIMLVLYECVAIWLSGLMCEAAYQSGYKYNRLVLAAGLMVVMQAWPVILLFGAGVLLAAVLVIGLQELFREFASARMLVFGLVMMVMMVIRPQGLLPARGRRFSLAALIKETGR